MGKSVTVYNLAREFAGSIAAPLQGVNLFARHRGRKMLAAVGPRGVDMVLQPSFAFNNVRWAYPLNNSTTWSGSGLSVASGSGTTQGISVVTSSFYGSVMRMRQLAAATSGSGMGFRVTNAPVHFSTTANQGGFHIVLKFGIGSNNGTMRMFAGLSTNSSTYSTSNPSTLTNQFGVCKDDTDTNLQFVTNSSGTATKTDLGSSFPVNDSGGVEIYELSMFSPSGGGQVVDWSVRNLRTGAFVTGTITANLPALATQMHMHIGGSNGSSATASSIDAALFYVETDN